MVILVPRPSEDHSLGPLESRSVHRWHPENCAFPDALTPACLSILWFLVAAHLVHRVDAVTLPFLAR